MRLPFFPGRLPRGPELLEVVLVAQGIHRLPEAFVEKYLQLAVARQVLHRLSFPYGRVVCDVVEYFRRKHKKAAVDPAAIALRFFLEAGDLRPFEVECAETPGGLHCAKRGGAAVRLV